MAEYALVGMSDPNELVRAFPVLRAVPWEELAALPCERVERQAGEYFFEQDSPGDAAWGILTGRVSILKRAAGGRELCLEVLGPGDLVGAVAVMRRQKMPAAALALDDAACLRIPSGPFMQLLERHPQVPMRLLDLVSRRLMEAGRSRLELATEEVEARLARALLRLADKFGAQRGEEIVFSQSFTRQNLADLAGTTVESAIRVLSRWTKAGFVRTSDGRIVVQDVDALAQRAGKAEDP